MNAPRRTPPALPAAALFGAALLAACWTTPPQGERVLAGDPTVVLHTAGRGELGVSTDYGVVFLGRGAKSGEVEFTVWFGDGPSFETGIVEPIGGDLYLTRSEILLPTVPLDFAIPGHGAPVVVRGRDAQGTWEVAARVAVDDRVEGMLLAWSEALDALSAEHTGAGVYVETDEGEQLVGLLSGKLELVVEDGERSFFTVAGPRTLWRLVTHARDLDRPRRRSHRGDVL
jgi:hypothetical protein